MKHFVLFALMIITAGFSWAQTYTTVQTGNYTDDNTWGGSGSRPPLSGSCAGCRIVIAAGHTLTINGSRTIDDVDIALVGTNSVLTLSNNTNLTLGGVSSIDIVPNARISKTTGSTATITLKGQVIFNSSSTRFNSTTNGLVNGPASAASVRANPNFFAFTLPVKLSEFRVAGKTGNVILNWRTDQEINTSHFEIERSIDGKTFSTIGQIAAAGNTGVEQNYEFTDVAPADGSNYYRLKIVDIDTKFEYSPIKTVSYASTGLNVVVGPNPATSFINVKVSMPGNEPYRLRLINRAGQVVFDQKYQTAGTRAQLNVANYADGSYFLEVSNNSGLKQISKVMIVRK